MLVKSVAAWAVLASASVGTAAAQVTQTTPPASSQTCCWNYQNLGTITFAPNTGSILALTSTAIAWDQGWGGYDPTSNQVGIQLFENSTSLWFAHVAGGVRDGYVANQYAAQTFDIMDYPGMLGSLNAAMAGIDWTTSPTVTMAMTSYGLGYPGWELYVDQASFSVTSVVATPEPATLTLMGSGLVAIGFIRRRKQAA